MCVPACTCSPRALLAGLLGAELILRRSSWMLLAIFISEGCLVKPRRPPGDEKRFLEQVSTATGSHTRLAAGGRQAMGLWGSGGEGVVVLHTYCVLYVLALQNIT